MHKLVQWMYETRTSQAELARLMDAHQPNVWTWVHGECLPSMANLRKLSVITGLTIDELVSQPAPKKARQRPAQSA